MTTLYERRGRRYHPISETDAYHGLTKGSYLVVVAPGCTSVSRMVEPAIPEVEAALKVAQDAMVSAMYEATRCKLDTRKMSPRVKAKYERAWAAWSEIVAEDAPMYFEGVSMQGIVEAGLEALRKKMGGSGPGGVS